MISSDGLLLFPHYRSLVLYSLKCRRELEGACEQKIVLWAAANGDTNLMSLLLRVFPSNLSYTNYFGQTAFFLVAGHGHGDAVELIIEPETH